MERIEHRSGYERRLVVDPEFLNSLVCIGDDDPLGSHPERDLDMKRHEIKNLTWNTGPYFSAHFIKTAAWSLPSWARFPTIGHPGISGIPLIFGCSDLKSNCMSTRPARKTAGATIWYDILEDGKEIRQLLVSFLIVCSDVRSAGKSNLITGGSSFSRTARLICY